MKFQLAQFNVARFRLPQSHPDNAEFVNSLDRVNAIAETQPGFVWRFTGDGNDALDVQAYDDPNVVVNLSVWTDLDALSAFVYKNREHIAIMRRRREWFARTQFNLVLWWIHAGHLPELSEARRKLDVLVTYGPSCDAFTFRNPFPPQGAEASSAAPP